MAGQLQGSTHGLGNRLRQVRERERLSLSTLSFLLAVPRRALERIEQGETVDGPAGDRVRRWLEGSVRRPTMRDRTHRATSHAADRA